MLIPIKSSLSSPSSTPSQLSSTYLTLTSILIFWLSIIAFPVPVKCYRDRNLFKLNKLKRVRSSFQMTPYIIGGVNAGENEFPYIVSIQKSTPSRYIHFCGGAIISPKIILTAAHCFKGVDAKDIAIQPNYNNENNKNAKRYQVEKLIPHENYKIIRNDIGLILLKEEIKPDSRISSVKLANGHEDRDVLTVAGWGQTESGFTSYLKRVDVLWHDDTICRQYYFRKFVDGMMCAGGNNKDSCVGDSGGPLVIRGKKPNSDVLVGLTSWGPVPCGTKPGVYVNVAYYLDWIIENTGLHLDHQAGLRNLGPDSWSEHQGELYMKLDTKSGQLKE